MSVDQDAVTVMVSIPRATFDLLREYAHSRGVNIASVLEHLAYERARGLRSPNADVARLWREGLTDQQIAEATGMLVRSVRDHRRAGNLMPANRPERRAVTVARMAKAGKNQQQIADELGIAAKSVETYFYQAKREGLFR